MTISVQLQECEEGDILASDIFNQEGVKLIASNTTVNPFIIDKLMQQGIESVRIYDPPVKWTKKYEKIDHGYKKQIMSIKGVVRELADGKKLNLNKVTLVADSIYKFMNEITNENIVRYISQIKRVDEYTYQHSLNVAFYSMLLGRWLNLSANEIKDALLAGLLHDIGKQKVPLEILNKPARLTTEEFGMIKKHPIYGYLILEESNFVNMEIKRAVLLHHERINRSGYPFNMPDQEIGVLTRIVAISDVYDAITSDRVYKKRTTPFTAFKTFLTDANENFDSYMVGKFVSNMAAMLTGSDVLLSNGEKGKVVYVPPHDILSPVVCANGKYISLAGSGLEIISLS